MSGVALRDILSITPTQFCQRLIGKLKYDWWVNVIYILSDLSAIILLLIHSINNRPTPPQSLITHEYIVIVGFPFTIHTWAFSGRVGRLTDKDKIRGEFIEYMSKLRIVTYCVTVPILVRERDVVWLRSCAHITGLKRRHTDLLTQKRGQLPPNQSSAVQETGAPLFFTKSRRIYYHKFSLISSVISSSIYTRKLC